MNLSDRLFSCDFFGTMLQLCHNFWYVVVRYSSQMIIFLWVFDKSSTLCSSAMVLDLQVPRRALKSCEGGRVGVPLMSDFTQRLLLGADKIVYILQRLNLSLEFSRASLLIVPSSYLFTRTADFLWSKSDPSSTHFCCLFGFLPGHLSPTHQPQRNSGKRDQMFDLMLLHVFTLV